MIVPSAFTIAVPLAGAVLIFNEAVSNCVLILDFLKLHIALFAQQRLI